MIDMGMHKGHHLFYTGGRSLRELMESGEIIAIPDNGEGIIYKRPANATALEKMASLSIEEALRITREWNNRHG